MCWSTFNKGWCKHKLPRVLSIILIVYLVITALQTHNHGDQSGRDLTGTKEDDVGGLEQELSNTMYHMFASRRGRPSGLEAGDPSLDFYLEDPLKPLEVRGATDWGSLEGCGGREYCEVNGRHIRRELLVETPNDTFTFLPPAQEGFLPQFKNPCWRGQDNLGSQGLFCLPYFYIIGFTKCGTTDLYALLLTHPLVYSRSGKESHYIDRARRGRDTKMHRPPDRLPKSFKSWVNKGTYRQQLLSTFYRTEESQVLFHGITMDATPSNVWDNEYWEELHPGHKEPPVVNSDLIAAINPASRVIFSIRDPIKRMQSAYQFFCKMRRTYPCDRPISPEKYHGLVEEAVRLFRDCRANNTVRGCTYSTGAHQLATHLYASIYHVYLRDFMAVLPREQLFVLQFEEHISHTSSSVDKLCDFLDIPRIPGEVLRPYLEEHEVRNQLRTDLRLPYVLPETTLLLEEFFKPHVRELVHLLGDTKWNWGRKAWQS